LKFRHHLQQTLADDDFLGKGDEILGHGGYRP